MALFIHRDNQTILWEILQQRPEIHVLTPSERPAWFKHHIQQFYENLPATWFQQPLTTTELNRLNQAVLRTMLETLRTVPVDRRVAQSQSFPDTRTMGSAFQDLDRPTASRIPPRGPAGGPNPSQAGATANNGPHSGGHLHEQFLQKQEEMKTFLQRPPPQQIDFKVTELDTPIANMDELIQQQLRERENLILPPPPPAPPTPPQLPPAPPVRTLNISSTDPLSHNILNILPIPPLATETSATSGIRERTVAFEEPDMEQMKRDIRTLQHDYRELENQLAALVLKMSANPTGRMNRARSW
uniref:Uncharacterized protein n=1 Tax=viral metagenome TaxID=1070528 RepID=A0A6C0EKW9_9ZZZZ